MVHESVDNQSQNAVKSIAFSPDGALIASGIYLEVALWDASDAERVRNIEHRHSVESLAFSPDGALIAAGQSMYGVQVSQVDNGEALLNVCNSYDSFGDFSPDGAQIASGNRDGVLRLWNVADGELAGEFEFPDADYMSAVAFAPDGQLVATGHFNGIVNLWQVSDGTLLHTLDSAEQFQQATSLAFSPDGQLLAVGGGSEAYKPVTRVWNVAEGTLVQTLHGHNNTVEGVAFSADGKLLASGSLDGTVRLWDVADWSLRHTLEHETEDGEPDPILCVAFSPSELKLAAGSRDSGAVWLWQVAP